MRWPLAGLSAGVLVLSACGADEPRSTNVTAVSPAARPLPCNESIGTEAPARDLQVVLGVVALPVSEQAEHALQTADSGLADPAARLFAKQGLVIRPDAHFRLIVPHRLRDRFSIGWGNAGERHRGSAISVDGCSGSRGDEWLAYAGGYFVRDPMCASLIVAAKGRRKSVSIGVGEACPGQRPPPEPTSE
jgi:hypothetical protein